MFSTRRRPIAEPEAGPEPHSRLGIRSGKTANHRVVGAATGNRITVRAPDDGRTWAGSL